MHVQDLSLLLNVAFLLCSEVHERRALCPLDRNLSLESRVQQLCLVQYILPAVLYFFLPEVNHCTSLLAMVLWKGPLLSSTL